MCYWHKDKHTSQQNWSGTIHTYLFIFGKGTIVSTFQEGPQWSWPPLIHTLYSFPSVFIPLYSSFPCQIVMCPIEYGSDKRWLPSLVCKRHCSLCHGLGSITLRETSHYVMWTLTQPFKEAYLKRNWSSYQ